MMMIRKTSFILAGFALAACGGGESTTSTGDTTTTTGSTTSTGTGGNGGEGGTPPVIQTLRISSRDSDKSLPNYHVFTSDADGHLAQEGDTDADGNVHLELPKGGSITAMEDDEVPDGMGGFYSGRLLYTFFDVPEGQAIGLRVSDPASFAPPPAPHTPMSSVSYYLPGVPAEATKIVITLSCLYPDVELPVSATNTYGVTDFAGCAGDSTYDAVIRAVDSKQNTIAYVLVKDAPFTEGQSSTTELDMSPVAPVHYLGTITNAPPGSNLSFQINGGRDLAFGSPQLISKLASVNATASMTGSYAFDLTVPSDAYEHWYTNATVGLSASTSVTGYQRFTQAAPPTPFALDVGAIAVVVPQLADVTDPQHFVIPYQLDGSNFGDTVVLSMNWGQGKVDSSWRAYRAPTAQGSARLPDLPPAYATWAFQSGDTFAATYAYATDSDAASSYAEYLGSVGTEFSGKISAGYTSP